MPTPFPTFLERAFAQGMRSTALQPLQWMLGFLLLATVGAPKAGAPSWLVILLASLSALCVALFGGSFIYLLRKNPDALRSERYTLQKMAIERGVLGDSTTGPLKAEDLQAQRILAIDTKKQLELGE